jgi:2EXR family
MDFVATSAIQRVHPLADLILQKKDALLTDKPNPSAGKIECASTEILEPMEFRFSSFPMLPAELRLKIWKLALPGPRIVEVCYDGSRDSRHEGFIRINTPPPAILHASWESRKVALEKYWLRLGNEEIKYCFAQIDPIEDTIFIPFNSMMNLQQNLINGTAWSKEAKENVRLLAVDARSWRRLRGTEGFVYFENLVKFTLVVHQSSGTQHKEKQRMPSMDLSFMDAPDEVDANDHHMSVESQMEFDNGHYGRQWKLPVIEVKIAARAGNRSRYS